MPKTETKNGKPAGPAVIEGQVDLLTEWMNTGLITKSQFSTFTRSAMHGKEEGIKRG
ncbi:hypothetical protein ACFQ71_02865 [Streptomyces sp. NPDC056534]|uniref:hypothetical protein n=1 Tax=Streptomyces sp. NPDC056534 TaxID=3345857 RepID=UPI003696D127